MSAVDDQVTQDEFRGEILVASRIVDYLSSGLYQTPSACLKELVNNSFDADATGVDIFVKPDADRIIIADDGIGMTRREFEEHFHRVSESHKRDSGELTSAGRPKVGKIGIGFIAANELCDVMEIASSKSGMDELLEVEVNFAKMREPVEQRRRVEEDFAKADYQGRVSSAPRSSHFTRVFLKQVRGGARAVLAGAARGALTSGEDSLYGLSATEIADRLSGDDLRAWSDLDDYSRTMLEVALNVPVRYAPGWLPPDLLPKVADFERKVDALDFTVRYDGSELRKPVVLRRSGNEHLLRRFDYEGEHVSAQGYFFAQHGTLKPQDLNGLLIRIRNAAVGGYDRGFFEFRPSVGPLFQDWISAEVWADDRLEDALNIDRRTLRTTHPAYLELQQVVHSELQETLGTVRRDLYQRRSHVRRTKEAQRELARFDDVLIDRNVKLPKRTRQALQQLAETSVDQRSARRLLTKYTVSQVYDTALEVAHEELPPELYRKFAKALAARLLS